MPTNDLTWSLNVSGDNFIDLLEKKYHIFSSEKSILELGPGYGRILTSILSKKNPFRDYLGVDISPNNIKELEKKFSSKNISFVKGNFSNVSLEKKFDVVISSLTLKHQFPTFFESLKNVIKFVNSDAYIVFDILESSDEFWLPNKEQIKELRYNQSTLVNLLNNEQATNELIKSGPKKQWWQKDDSTNNPNLKDDCFIGAYSQKEILMILEQIPLLFLAFDHVIHHEKKGERLVVIAKKI